MIECFSDQDPLEGENSASSQNRTTIERQTKTVVDSYLDVV